MPKMFNILRRLDPLVHFLFLLAIGVLGFFLYTQRSEIEELQKQLTLQNPSRTVEVVKTAPSAVIQTQSSLDEQAVKDLITEALSEVPSPSSQVIFQQTAQPQDKSTTYLPLGDTASTTEKDWKDIYGSEAYVDVKNDYGDNAYIEFEAALKVDHGNGTAFVRIYDVTNKIAVSGSELSSANNMDYTLVKSGRIYLWQGRNLYRLQMKSLNGFSVFLNNARLKVSY